MPYINMLVSNPAKITIKNNKLVVRGEKEIKLPIEDINSLLIESRECLISSFALSKLIEKKCVIYVCDDKHIPSGYLIPYNSYYRKLSTLQKQINIPKPLKKRLWQKIVIQKIKNQAKVLEYQNRLQADKLIELSKKVQSNDKTNVEALAANIYFRSPYGDEFSRTQNILINSILNYGYTIIRGLIARNIAIVGFEPCIGIFHSNNFNPFNLADDLIEPFRPVVDLFSCSIDYGIQKELTSNIKRQIYNLLNCDVTINNQKYALSYAVEIMVSSLLKSISSNQDLLLLPDILPLKVHRYE